MNVLLKTILISSAIFYSVNSFALTKVNIHFPGAEGKIATVWAYKDLISLSREVITQIPIDKNGNLKFKVYNTEVKNYHVEVRYLRISFLLEANKNYQIDIAKVDFNNRNLYPKDVVGYLSPNFSIKIKGENGFELNKELDSLNIIFDDFVHKNHLALRRGNYSWRLVDSLQAQCAKYTSIHSNPYLKDFVDIQLAQFRKLTNQFGDDYIVKTYFAPKKIKYSNPAFMSYFNAFWTKYIPNRLRNNVRIRIDSAINIEQSYQALSALLSEDSLLKDENLRELVILRNIPQLYNAKGVNRNALINILYDISASKNNSQHKQIAINMRNELIRKNAPSFSFIDSNTDTINLADEKGKYIYIQIFDNDCISCLAEMNYTKELYEEFEDIITFIHVSLDRSNDDMLKTIEDKDYPWHFVFLENNYQFINDYNISVVPQAILIDKDGSIINLNAIQPSNYFKDSFLKMLNDRKNNLKQKPQLSDGIREQKNK